MSRGARFGLVALVLLTPGCHWLVGFNPPSSEAALDAPSRDSRVEGLANVRDALSVEGAQVDAAKKADASHVDAPKADAPKADAPKADAPKADAPKADAPKADKGKLDTGKVDGGGSGAVVSALAFGSTGNDVGESVAALSGGGVAIVGAVQNSTSGACTISSNGGGDRGYLAEFSSYTSCGWNSSAPTTASSTSSMSHVVAAASYWVTGQFTGSVGSPFNWTSQGAADGLVVQVSSHVNTWSKQLGSSGADSTLGAAVDGSGNIYVTGSFGGTINFTGSSVLKYGTTCGFLASYTSTGGNRWTVPFCGSSSKPGDASAGTAVVVASTGGQEVVCVAARVAGGIVINAAPSSTTGFAVACYSLSGSHHASKVITAPSAEAPALAAHGGTLYVGGSFTGMAGFIPTALTADARDGFVARLDLVSGSLQGKWTSWYSGAGDEEVRGLAVDTAGKVFLTGWSNSATLNVFGSPPGGAAGNDIIVGGFVDSGTGMGSSWGKRFGSSGLDEGRGITVDVAGKVVVTGRFSNTVTFGSTTLTSTGGTDVFLAVFQP